MRQLDIWCETFPELSTRPLLVAFMRQPQNAWLRSHIFHFTNDLGTTVNIKDGKVAMRILHICQAHHLRWIRKQQTRLEVVDHNIFNELLGFYRNLFKNMMLRINPRAKAMFTNQDVERKRR